MTTNIDTTTAAPRRRSATTEGMSRSRRVALWAGLLYLLTFVASFPQLALFRHLVDDPSGYVTSAGSDAAVRLGSWLEILTAFACVGTAIALYPITRRVSRAAAIGFISTRIVEAAVIMAGVMCVLAVVTLHADLGGAASASDGSVGLTGAALVALRQATFLIGPGIVPALNAMFLGYVMYRSGLVPRLLPIVGLIGAPVLLLSSTVTILGGWDQVSATATLCALPIAAWELGLGVWMTFKGFRESAVTTAYDGETSSVARAA